MPINIAEPKVYVISVPVVPVDTDSNILDFMQDNQINNYESFPSFISEADLLPEYAGKLCYMSYDNPKGRRNAAYLDHIKEVGHGSVLEHTNIGVIITGVSRSLTHELVRHRAGMSYSQLSQRYVDESDTEFVPPPKYLDRPMRMCTWQRACEFALGEYINLVNDELLNIEKPTTAERKQAREAARSVLPNCTETKIFVTGNGRSWRHFLELRGSKQADAEIRRLALLILDVLKVAAPNIFSDYAVVDGEIVTEYEGV